MYCTFCNQIIPCKVDFGEYWHDIMVLLIAKNNGGYLFLQLRHICKPKQCYSRDTHQICRVIQNYCRGTIVQPQFRTKSGKQPQSDNSAGRWYSQFQETGCVCNPELKVRITTAIETITANMLQLFWNEINYRVDVCRITKGANI